ncbi:MAG: hypothetical protein ACI88L_000716 [Candidatus Paceibacteria bacterium]|jgi:hypothetical protein
MEKTITDFSEISFYAILIGVVVFTLCLRLCFALWLRKLERDKDRLKNDFTKDYWNVDSYINEIKKFKFYHSKYRSLIGEFKKESGKEKKDRVQDLIAPVIGT